MKFVANCNIWLKCYITFRYIVADEKRGSPYLARAIANLKLILEKNIKNRLVYSFLTSTVIFSLLYLLPKSIYLYYLVQVFPLFLQG